MSARSEFDALRQGVSQLAKQGYIKPKEEYIEEHEEFVPPDNIVFADVTQGDEVYNNPITQHVNHYEEQYSGASFDTNEFDNDDRPRIENYEERLWDGGPLTSEVESWKKQYSDIYIADDIDPNNIFIFRTINRYEYKAIVAAPNTDPLMREEMICEQCVLFPYEYGYGLMSKQNAGNVTTLAEHILMTSGFTKASEPRRL